MACSRTVVFVAWLAAIAVLPLAQAAADDNARGAELFQLCAQCHGAAGDGKPATLAPSIAGLSQWYVDRQLHGFRAGHRGQHFDDIGGMRMRPMARWLPGEDDIAAVSAYVAALPAAKPAPVLSGGDAARGAQLFAPCTACHGAEGKGNQQLNAPPIDHASDWYLLTQLKNFKAGVRGAKPGDTTGALMRPMAALLPDEQAMKDVVAHIMTLAK
jgi:cytochrome c553